MWMSLKADMLRQQRKARGALPSTPRGRVEIIDTIGVEVIAGEHAQIANLDASGETEANREKTIPFASTLRRFRGPVLANH
jgi:hypothetical protein